ncbi:MAG: thioredoxin family protein [Proteobacteria bacterium]|jgi:thioredoxin 1|nr:thioredoxin family protein [Pseudomonadota bacterium]
MTRGRPLFLLALAIVACASPDLAQEKKSPLPATAPPPPAPMEVESVPEDAGAPEPRLPALSLGRPMLIDFAREDCLPCKLMEPWLAELRKRHAGAIEVLEIDLEHPESRAIARYFKAKSVPMQVYVDARGREVSRNVGLATLPEMQRQLEKLGFLEPPKK